MDFSGPLFSVVHHLIRFSNLDLYRFEQQAILKSEAPAIGIDASKVAQLSSLVL